MTLSVIFCYKPWGEELDAVKVQSDAMEFDNREGLIVNYMTYKQW